MANYLPMLLVSVTTNAIPDDTSVSTQPRGQVDYLSHEWREEDVWRSWRNMTRQKNEIANGMRLENASWRTWWKQRNKLKTVSPETLNWLKDSDVTWLYGPLHTAVDWSPPPKPTPDPTSVDKDHSTHDRLGLSTDSHQHHPSKPILKHRSISDLLTSALPNHMNTDEEDEDAELYEDEDDEPLAPVRPTLLHTKSDTNITRWARNHPFRKVSPPRIIAPVTHAITPLDPEISDLPMPIALGERSGSSDSARDTTSSSQDLSSTVNGGGKKKHISFNTFVEQFIAIDSPPAKKRGSLPREPRGLYDEGYDEGYDEDTEAGYNDADDVLDEGGLFSEGQNGSDSDEEDDDILEMRTSSTRSRSSSSSRSPGVSASYTRRPQPPSSYNPRPPLVRTSSSDKEHMTIAPIAPTILKTTGVGNHYVASNFGRGRGNTNCPSPSINLVYVPPIGGGYSERGGTNGSGSSSSDDVYRHREARFSIGASTDVSPSGSQSPSESTGPCPTSVPAAQALPIPGPEHFGHVPYIHGAMPARVLSPPNLESPMGSHDEGYDYFGITAAEILTADLAVNMPDADLGVDMMQPPENILDGHMSRDRRNRSGSMPEVVVNDENGAIEERREVEPSPSRSRSRSQSRSFSRSRSRSRSHSRTPSPAEMMSFEQPADESQTAPPSFVAVSVARTGSSHSFNGTPQDATHLSPPMEYLPSRGRTPPASAPPISTSNLGIAATVSPTDVRSRSFSHDRESRGRSSTRNSSFSDREHSVSRSSLVAGSGSPLGSVSPTSSSTAIMGGAPGGYSQGRGRDPESRMRKGSFESAGSALRGRPGRRVGAGESSVSPSSPTGGEGRSLDAIAAGLPSSSSIPNEPSSSSPRHAKPAPVILIPNIPTPIKEEEEPARAAQASALSGVTRALSPPAQRHSSPADIIRPAVPAPPTSATAPVHAERPERSAKPSSPTLAARPSSPTSPTEDGGGLVGRAAEIVFSARGFLGAFWHNSGSGPHVA